MQPDREGETISAIYSEMCFQYPGELDASDSPAVALPLRDEVPIVVLAAEFVCAPP
jgi:hypothetical protein